MERGSQKGQKPAVLGSRARQFPCFCVWSKDQLASSEMTVSNKPAFGKQRTAATHVECIVYSTLQRPARAMHCDPCLG